MEKYINRKKYSTDDAEAVGFWDNGRLDRDLYSQFETLYRKPNGEYFLHGEGGAFSDYAVHIGCNSTRGGAKIIPLSLNEARNWAEEHLSGKEVDSIFGELPDDSYTLVGVYLPAAFVDSLRKQVNEKGVSVSDYLATLIQSNHNA